MRGSVNASANASVSLPVRNFQLRAILLNDRRVPAAEQRGGNMMSNETPVPRDNKNSGHGPQGDAREMPEDVLSQELVSKLQSAANTQVQVPRSVDDAILADAAAVLAASRQVRKSSQRRRWVTRIATAGSLAALVFLTVQPFQTANDVELADRGTFAPMADDDLSVTMAMESASNVAADAADATVMAEDGAITTAAAEDINRDGRVDILDAYVLADRIEQQQRISGDVNNDGVTDREDIRLVAFAAVRL
jgi:hypothetical protein